MRIGRVSSREAERATLPIVSTNACAGTVTTASPDASGKGGKSSPRSVRMWNCAEPETISTSCSAERSSIETSEAGSARTTSSVRRAGTTHGALALDLRLERDAQADLHVGGAQLDAAALRDDLHAAQRLDGRARGGDTGDGLQLREQL